MFKERVWSLKWSFLEITFVCVSGKLIKLNRPIETFKCLRAHGTVIWFVAMFLELQKNAVYFNMVTFSINVFYSNAALTFLKNTFYIKSGRGSWSSLHHFTADNPFVISDNLSHEWKGTFPKKTKKRDIFGTRNRQEIHRFGTSRSWNFLTVENSRTSRLPHFSEISDCSDFPILGNFQLSRPSTFSYIFPLSPEIFIWIHTSSANRRAKTEFRIKNSNHVA